MKRAHSPSLPPSPEHVESEEEDADEPREGAVSPSLNLFPDPCESNDVGGGSNDDVDSDEDVDQPLKAPRIDFGPDGSTDKFGKVQYTDDYGEWRSVPGFEPTQIIVSSLGWVRAKINRGGQLSQPHKAYQSQLTGYHSIKIGPRQYYVHRLVCRAFNGPQPDNCTCDHILKHDGNFLLERGDNRACNVRWATLSVQGKNRNTAKNYRCSLPIFVRHRDWPETTPSMWFPSGMAAERTLGVKSINNVANPDRNEKSAHGFLATRAFAEESQHDLPGEAWIEARENLLVSNMGRAQVKMGHGSWGVKFTPRPNPGTVYAVACGLQFHSIVYEAFNGALPPGATVDHKDRNRVNNVLSNLRALTKTGQCLNQVRSRGQPSYIKIAIEGRPRNNPFATWQRFTSQLEAANILSERLGKKFRQPHIGHVASGGRPHHLNWEFRRVPHYQAPSN